MLNFFQFKCAYCPNLKFFHYGQMWAHIRAAHSIKRLYDEDKPRFENVPFAIKRSQRFVNIDQLVEARVAQVLASRENASESASRDVRAIPGTNNVRVTFPHGSNSHGLHPVEGFTRITRTVREETVVEEFIPGL